MILQEDMKYTEDQQTDFIAWTKASFRPDVAETCARLVSEEAPVVSALQDFDFRQFEEDIVRRALAEHSTSFDGNSHNFQNNDTNQLVS